MHYIIMNFNMYTIIIVVMVGFEKTMYSVLESQPSSVNMCVVLNGTTERKVDVDVTAMDLTATSRLLHLHCINFHNAVAEYVLYPLQMVLVVISSTPLLFSPFLLETIPQSAPFSLSFLMRY